MKIVFCGSGDVAVPTLEALHTAGIDIEAVFTQPPRQAGRGGKLKPTPVNERACELGLSVIQCQDINAAEHVELMQRLAPRLMVVVDFGQKIRLPARQTAQWGAINMHASLLPALRGAAPVNWAIIDGLSSTGVTTFQLVDRMDAGPILLQRATPIVPEETAEELRARLAGLGAKLVQETITALQAGAVHPAEQDETRATHARKLTKADGMIDFADDALVVANRICGLWPWPGAQADFCHANRPPVRVIFARARALLLAEPDNVPAGTLTADLTVAAAGGRVQILQLKVAGKRLMDWDDFVNGYRPQAGDRFACPSEGQANVTEGL